MKNQSREYPTREKIENTEFSKISPDLAYTRMKLHIKIEEDSLVRGAEYSSASQFLK